MLRFSTESFRDVTYFDGDGDRMLEAMGCSGRVPGALSPEDLPGALKRLRAAISAQEATQPEGAEEAGEDEAEPKINLARRMAPLVELLEAAVAADDHVTWRRV